MGTAQHSSFLLRDATLVQYTIWLCVRPSARLSVCHISDFCVPKRLGDVTIWDTRMGAPKTIGKRTWLANSSVVSKLKDL